MSTDWEDYGQVARYKGTIENQEKGFLLDGHHYFAAGKIELVCGNSWKMLSDTRFKDDFEFFGDFSKLTMVSLKDVEKPLHTPQNQVLLTR